MLADVGLGEAEAVGEHDRLLVLGEDGGVVALGMMERHGEHAELDAHGGRPRAGAVLVALFPYAAAAGQASLPRRGRAAGSA